MRNQEGEHQQKRLIQIIGGLQNDRNSDRNQIEDFRRILHERERQIFNLNKRLKEVQDLDTEMAYRREDQSNTISPVETFDSYYSRESVSESIHSNIKDLEPEVLENKYKSPNTGITRELA